MIVIGSGAGGGTIAYRLSQHGLRILLVEAGGALPTDRAAHEPIGAYVTDRHPDRSVPMRFVGGQTKFYGSALYRFRKSDFAETIHEAGTSPAWPITYEELEPYYGEAEALYRVHGDSAADPTEPPRSKPLPFGPIPNPPLMAGLVERIDRTGLHAAPIPRGLDWRGGAGPCTLCATCDAHHCRIDAKMDTDVAAIRPALATGRVTLMTETQCLRVQTSADGRRVEGVQLLRGGAEQDVRADKVVVACGLPGSAALLRASRTAAHPEGLGNAGGALGRYLAGHSTGMVFPFVSFSKVPPTHTKTFAINDYYEASPGWNFPTGVIQMSGQMPFWNEASRPIRPIAKLVAHHALTVFYMTEALPTPESGWRFDGDRLVGRTEPMQNMQTFWHLRKLTVAMFRAAGHVSLARKRPPQMWHEVGTARMGSDPATSVVDPNLEVHGIAGLHVVDASVLPSAGAVNTGLTIMAMALRCADYIAGGTSARQKAALA